ncbi:MAG: hypothetical protein V3S30_00750 [Thermoanaerobaculia bacterium]
MKEIELITFKGCEPTVELREALENKIDDGEIDIDLKVTLVASPGIAEEMGLFGSPTIRIDGEEHQATEHGPPGFY